jgi:hypothetical protein
VQSSDGVGVLGSLEPALGTSKRQAPHGLHVYLPWDVVDETLHETHRRQYGSTRPVARKGRAGLRSLVGYLATLGVLPNVRVPASPQVEARRSRVP